MEIRKVISIDRAVMLVLLAVQATTIVYLYRTSAKDRREKAILCNTIEIMAYHGGGASSMLPPTVPPLIVGNRHGRSSPFLHAHEEMEGLLDSIFGSDHNRDLLLFDSPGSELDGFHGRALSLLESSFDEFRRAGESMGPGGRMDLLVVSPAMDMREFDDCYLVALSLPRVRKPDLSVTLEGRVLCVSGRQNDQSGEMQQFEKRVRLPGPVVAQSVRAILTNSILRIVAPKGGETVSDTAPARIM